jgi:hypothetical protein
MTEKNDPDDNEPNIPKKIEKNQPLPKPTPDPTRYKDWEKNGRCFDF